MFDPMINEANGSSSACPFRRVFMVETNAPPFHINRLNYDRITGSGQGSRVAASAILIGFFGLFKVP